MPAPTWAGAEHLDRLIMIGTPNAGSAKSLLTLVEGVHIAPFLPTYEAALLGTMPAIYQLMPRDRHGALVDAQTDESITGLYDAARWQQMAWGLASPEPDELLKVLLPNAADAAERRRIAQDHLAKCLARAEQLHAALDVASTPPPGVEIHLFAGDSEGTAAIVAVDPATGWVWVREHGPGDGTVLRTSAVMDERLDGDWTPRLRTPIAWTSVRFLFQDHLGLTKDAQFTDNVLYLLIEAP